MADDTDDFYRASFAKLFPAGMKDVDPFEGTRRRADNEEMELRAEFLLDYAQRHAPVTIRQLYYASVVHHLPGIDKTQDGYIKIQNQVLKLRRSGRMPYNCIADLSRRMRAPQTFDSVADALEDAARYYRKSLWTKSAVWLELWCEKDALTGALYPVTQRYDVPLASTRGYASETFVSEAVAARKGDRRLYVVWYLGDYDRSGQDAAEALREKLYRFAAECGIKVKFDTLAFKPEHIHQYNRNEALVDVGNQQIWLPTHAPKRESAADKNWPHDYVIELDAIEPDLLRQTVRDLIEQYLPAEKYNELMREENKERRKIRKLVDGLEGVDDDDDEDDEDEDDEDEDDQ